MIRRLRIFTVVLCLLLACLTAVAQDGQIVREIIDAPSLEGNLLGDTTRRHVTIYLPPGYDDGDNLSYPVVYLLHGYGANHNRWTDGAPDIASMMKSWLKSGKIEEMILVMPNSYNKFWGSWYTNSVTTGKWGDYIARDLVKYIDSSYRTLPQRESRGVIGHSMGGYGGMTMGLDYPDVFGCMGSMSGLLDMEQKPASISWGFALGAELENLSDFYSQNGYVKEAISMSAAFAPNPDNPPFYADFAWERDDTNHAKLVKNEEVWERIMAHDILGRIPASEGVLRNMLAIYFDCGTADENNFVVDARRVRDELQRLGISYDYREFPGNHNCCVIPSTGNALEVFSEAMAFDILASVEPTGKLATTWGQMRSR